jgi:hypothetical protein
MGTRGASLVTDAAAVLEDVNRVHGTAYRMVRPLAGGYQGHAFMIGDQSGRATVLKWGTNLS